MKRTTRALAFLVALTLVAAACGSDGDGAAAPDASPTEAEATEITVYSGRNEELVGPLIEKFEKETGITVKVRYGDTAELASLILEEGDATPADVYYGQDAGALGALQGAGVLADLPEEITGRVPELFRSREGKWVGTSGRVRVVVYHPERTEVSELPDSVLGFTDPAWKGRVGWAPTNGSFQSFVTALRIMKGDDAARTWLEEMKANGAVEYPKNSAIVKAVDAGEIDAGLVNHYYAFQLRDENPDLKAKDHFLPAGDPGGLVNVAGAGVLKASDAASAAERFIAYLLSETGQRYFVEETFEYPLVPGIEPADELPAIDTLEAPDVDLSNLSDLEGTLELLQEVGLL